MELTREDTLKLARDTWGPLYDGFEFLSPEEASLLQERRDALLDSIADGIDHAFGRSKPHTGPLSPGCSFCGRGQWSCVFVTRNCNASCYYCPAPRAREKMSPWADGLSFEGMADFIEYARALEIKGVSFSGGEPLLLGNVLADYVREVRQAFDRDVYIWAYTNGLTVTARKLERLAAAGLDEIRFNIGADDYRLDKTRLAVGRVPRVTVEIPVAPEELRTLKARVREMGEIGVDHLNLHEMMAFGANFSGLQKRGCRFIPGSALLVANSELAALELTAFTLQEGIEVPINYCSTIFKSRWQTRGANRRVNRLAIEPFEGETEFGYVRRLFIEADVGEIDHIARRFAEVNGEDDRWRVDPEAGRILFHHELLGHIDGDRQTVHVQYFRPLLAFAGSEGALESGARPIELSTGKRLAVSMHPLAEPIALSSEELRLLQAALRGDGEAQRDNPTGHEAIPRVDKYERVGVGLAEVVAG